MAISNSAVENRGPAFEPGDMEGEQIAQMFGELTKLIDKMNAKKSSASSNVGSDPNFSQPVGPVAECLLSGGPSFSSIAVSAEKHPDDEASKLLEVCEASKYEESITEADAVWNDLQNRAIKVMQRRREKRSAGGGVVLMKEHQKALARLEEAKKRASDMAPLSEVARTAQRICTAEDNLNGKLVSWTDYQRLVSRTQASEEKAEQTVSREEYHSALLRAEDAERMMVVVTTAAAKFQEKRRGKTIDAMSYFQRTQPAPRSPTSSFSLSWCMAGSSVDEGDMLFD